MNSTSTLLSVKNLTKSYGGVHAVRGVSFELKAGEILALIGPNGAGKSTCFDMLNGQIGPDQGRIALLGEDTTGQMQIAPAASSLTATSSGSSLRSRSPTTRSCF